MTALSGVDLTRALAPKEYEKRIADDLPAYEVRS